MVALAAMGSLMMTGCAAMDMQESGAGSGATVPGAALNGIVHGGNQPVVGATVQLYAVGLTGYGSAATPLLTKVVTSGANGSFSISGDYSCSSGTYVYLTATGGNPGLNATTNGGSAATPNNPASAMVAALGDCGKLTSGTNVWMNEVTTVAAVWALQQFVAIVPGTTLAAQPGTAAGVTPAVTPAFSIGTSATNVQGLANAFEVAGVLASTTTGSSPGAFAAAYTGPGTSANRVLTVENWHVNTIADVLAACVNTDTTTGNADYSGTCSALGTAVTPSGTAAADTLQIAYEMAQNPTYNVSTTFGYVPASGAAFVPDDTAVADWTVAYGVQYNYSANTANSDDFTVLNTGEGIAFDSYGNAWIGNTGHQYSYLNAYLTELDPAGNYVSTYNSYSVGGTSTSFAEALAYNAKMQIAIDPSNNVWVADTGNYNLVRFSGASAAGTAAGAGLGVSYGTSTGSSTNLASDAAGNMYITLAGATYSSTFGTSGNKGLGVLVPSVNGTTLSAGTGSTVEPTGNTTFAGIAVTQSSSSTYGGGGFLYATSTTSYCSAPGGASLNMYFTKAATVTGSNSSTTTTIGQPTPVNAIANSPTSGTCTTVGSTVPSATTTYGGASYTVPAMDAMQGLSVDSSDNLWTVNAPSTVYASGFPQYWASELTPQYVTIPTTGALAAAYSPNVYTASILSGTSNGATLTFQPGMYMATDGGNNIWIQSAGALGTVASVSAANGVLPTAPIIATGFPSGTTSGYSGDWVCAGYCGGLTNTFYSSRRDSGGAGSGIAVDLSGNVWKIYSNSGADSVQILVGAAVPAVLPLSLAAKNHAFGKRP
jgi:hypothetical protein